MEIQNPKGCKARLSLAILDGTLVIRKANGTPCILLANGIQVEGNGVPRQVQEHEGHAHQEVLLTEPSSLELVAK